MDWDKIATLLHIAEKTNQWPQLHGLRNAALAELQKHDELRPVVETKPQSPPGKQPEPETSPASKTRLLGQPEPGNGDQGVE